MADNTQNKKKRNTWGLVAIPLLPLVIALFFLWTWFQPQSVDTSEGLQILKEAQIERVVVNDGTQQVNLVLKDPWTHKSTGVNDRERSLGRNISFTYARTQSQSIVESVEKANPGKGWDAYYPQASFLSSTLAAILPLALVMGLFWFFMSRMGGSQMMGPFGQSRTKDFNQERPNVTFADVAGEDEAVEELEEVREFLIAPEKFRKVGARIPRGVLLLERVRPCWRRQWRVKLKLPSSLSQVRNSLRCMSVLALRVCVILYPAPRRLLPRLSSSMKSIRSVVTAVLVMVAVLMNAIRPSTSCWLRWTALTTPRT